MADAYRALLGARLRAQTSYRASFALDLLANVGIGLLEFCEIYVIFHNIDVLGGLDWQEALLVFALSNIAFSLADLGFGHLDELPRYLRAGTLDAMLLRPLPLLGQLVTSDISLRRLGRTAIALVVLAYALPTAVADWTPAKLLLVLVTPIAGAAVFAALFVCAAALQFWLVDGGEVANAFTYGGSYVSQYPSSVLHVLLRSFFTFVVPASFVAYLPTLVLLDRSPPTGLPAALGWCAPLAAMAMSVVAAAWWRQGIRHYTGAGG
ncbi:MAG TPA: ABC-2 family transporter protein [Mycobacteriales bacterium]|nr:ABC-2 family transporter protein [Mycobacteriales bacterium]